MVKGGGTRNIALPLKATLEEIKTESIKLFFPNGENSFAGKASETQFGIANFQLESVSNEIQVNDTTLPFSLQNWSSPILVAAFNLGKLFF